MCRAYQRHERRVLFTLPAPIGFYPLVYPLALSWQRPGLDRTAWPASAYRRAYSETNASRPSLSITSLSRKILSLGSGRLNALCSGVGHGSLHKMPTAPTRDLLSNRVPGTEAETEHRAKDQNTQHIALQGRFVPTNSPYRCASPAVEPSKCRHLPICFIVASYRADVRLRRPPNVDKPKDLFSKRLVGTNLFLFRLGRSIAFCRLAVRLASIFDTLLEIRPLLRGTAGGTPRSWVSRLTGRE